MRRLYSEARRDLKAIGAHLFSITTLIICYHYMPWQVRDRLLISTFIGRRIWAFEQPSPSVRQPRNKNFYLWDLFILAHTIKHSLLYQPQTVRRRQLQVDIYPQRNQNLALTLDILFSAIFPKFLLSFYTVFPSSHQSLQFMSHSTFTFYAIVISELQS